MHSSMMMAVNSPPVAHRGVSNPTSAAYRPCNDDYSAIHQAPRPQPEDPERKKDKKWSFGKLFRRKKKEDETASSSESDEGISRSSSSKRKLKKKKRATTTVNNFDHIVVRDTRRAQSLVKSNYMDLADDGVLSDPSAGFINYRARLPQQVYGESKESLNDSSRSARTTLDTPARKTRKGRLKARVEALRNSMKGDSSSEEGSLKSSNDSSMIRFRSDDSLMRSRDSSLNKRSRSARNERYIKRLSRDEENQLNKEAELLQQGYSKAEVEMLTRTPTSQSSGYGTCKREQPNKNNQEHLYANEPRRPMKSESISSFPSTQSYLSSINFNAKVNNDHVNYSIQYPSNNTNRESLYANNNRQQGASDQYEIRNANNVMCVKFPLGNVTNINRDDRAPPVPPPRDMHRKVATPVSMYYENNPMVADRMDGNKLLQGVPNNDFERVMRRSQERSLNHSVNGLRRPISNSEDHIALQNLEYLKHLQFRNEQPRRPASVSAEPHHYGLYANTPPWRKKVEQPIAKPEPMQLNQDYLYYADQSPRSRRPISIKTSQNGHDNKHLSDSQSSLNPSEIVHRKPRNASEFWKKLDDAESNRRQQHNFAHSRQSSEFSSNSHLPGSQYFDKNAINQNRNISSDIQNRNVTKANSISRDTTDSAKVWKATTEYKRAFTVEPQTKPTSPTKTHTRHKSDTFVPVTYQMPSDDEKTSERRKSTNLDDALNELEAIYNSLGLGDEDLLDRAERREMMTPRYKDQFNDWNGNDDELILRSQPTTPLRRLPRRSTLPDKLQDDMAFRRMNSKERQINTNKDSPAQISYMLASPVYIPYASDDDRYSDRNEPDIVYDDVMYRNIKQANNHLKTVDPQPPFGIPVGPVSPAPQSDYLHAVPENKGRSRFIPRRSPDLVSDDLAYRSLRKDGRLSTHYNGDDFIGHVNNNQSEYPDIKDPVTSLKKKRAVRSLSANIFTMIQKEIDDALNMSKVATIQKTKSNSDVARRMRESFESNDDDKEQYPRNKVKQRHHTVNLFVNNIHNPSTHHFSKDDSYIHGDEKFLSKPPSCDMSKSSSPSNRSPQTAKRSSRDEFQHVLTMLAQEAMDTSNKLGVALAELDKNRNNSDKKSDIQSKISDSRLVFLNGLTNHKPHEHTEPEIKHVHVHSEVISNNRPDNKQSSHNNLKGKRTEDSLMAISDQLHKVEDQLKHSIEKEMHIEDESKTLSNYIVQTKSEEKLKAQETTVVAPETKLTPGIVPLTIQNDSVKVKADWSRHPQTSNNSADQKPTNLSENKTNDLNKINAFKELKEGISDLIAGISQVNEKLSIKPHKDEPEEKHAGDISISAINKKLIEVAQSQPTQSPNRGSVNISIYEDDLEAKREAGDSTEYNSSEELATIFKSDSANPVLKETKKVENVRDLCSPKLVQNMNQQLRRFSVDNTDEGACATSQSNPLPTNIVPWRTKRQNNSQTDNRGDDSSPKTQWHQDPGTLMLACSYTLMITQHFAHLDWLTLLGLLLAMITVIAMLIL